MVLWQSELRVSWRAQWLSLLLHGVVAGIVLILPWPLNYLPVWLILLSLVVLDCVRSQRRINARHGEIKLLDGRRLSWKNQTWNIVGNPWMFNTGMLVRLRGKSASRTHYLWVAADGMEQSEWRELRRILLQTTTETPH